MFLLVSILFNQSLLDNFGEGGSVTLEGLRNTDKLQVLMESNYSQTVALQRSMSCTGALHKEPLKIELLFR
jgi:hypothetical protein